MHMRIHIQLNDEIVSEIDAVAGPRHGSAFVREAVLGAFDRHRRTRLLRQTAGILGNSEHEWDDDPATRARRQSVGGPRRVG